MRCHQCNQDSIKIHKKSEDVDSPVYIECDICGLHIRCGKDVELLCNLFIYNENLEAAEILGKEAFEESKEMVDNPYSLDSNQIILNKRWELGYLRERESYEFSALSFSSEKIENELKEEISALTREREQHDINIRNFTIINHTKINDFCDKLLKIKVLGKFLTKRIALFLKDYKEFYHDNMGAILTNSHNSR